MAVAVRLDGAVGAAQVAPDRTSIPLSSELLTTEVNWTTYWPLELAFIVNCSMTALFCAPAVAKISKLVNTCVPLMLTSKVRDPAELKNVSAKCRRTVCVELGLKPGMV